jgi:hypothetical protein
VCTIQVDTFGSADPYVCVSALAVSRAADHATHDHKAKEAQKMSSGSWVLPPQGLTKTLKNELNPVFEEDFVIDCAQVLDESTCKSKELTGQDVTLLVTVHDWNRTSSDVLLGQRSLTVNAGHKSQKMYALKNNDGTDIKNKSGKPSSVTISIEYQMDAGAKIVTREASRESHRLLVLLSNSKLTQPRTQVAQVA